MSHSRLTCFYLSGFLVNASPNQVHKFAVFDSRVKGSAHAFTCLNMYCRPQLQLHLTEVANFNKETSLVASQFFFTTAN